MRVLEHPYETGERRPVIVDRVLFIPSRFEDHGLQWQEFADQSYIELGSGNGEWIINRALQRPDCLWIAVEKKFKRVKKIYKKGGHLSNLWIVCGDAFTFLERYVRSGSINQVYLNFPDPWPKRAHAHHRMVQFKMKELLNRILKTNGQCTLTTDDYSLIEQAEKVFSDWDVLKKEKHNEDILEQWGASYFARLWLGRNKAIYQSVYGVLSG